MGIFRRRRLEAEQKQEAHTQRVAKAKRLHGKGYSINAIAHHMGVAESTVRGWLKVD